MAKTQAVWGIDLGRCALKAIKLRQVGDDKIEILAHDYIEHAQILTQPDADRPKLISDALEKFLSRNDVSRDAVIVSVPGQHTLARFTKLPPVAAKRIPDIVRYEADQQIPFDMDEVIWDYQTFQREGLPDLEVGIFAMKRELLREHLLHFEQASIEPLAVQCSPLAVYNGALFDGMLAEKTTILLDIGAENTDLIICDAESFWTRTVPIGGNAFTEALVKSFKLSFSKAESLKRTADSSKYARQIFQAMRPIFADLVQELQRSIGFYSSTHRDTRVEKVVCLGNACKLPGLQKYLQQNLSLPVEKPDAFHKATPVGGADGSSFTEEILSFGVAYGLAVQGMDLGKVTSNLLPTEIAKQVVWRKKRPAFAAAAACILIAGGLVWFRQSADMRTMAAGDASVTAPRDVDEAWNTVRDGPSPSLPPRAQARAILEAGNALKRELGSLTGQGATERRQTEELIALQKRRSMIPKILQVIHESLPPPDGALGAATTQGAALAALASAPPREERRQLWLRRVHMQYEQDVNAELVWESIVKVPAPINDPDSPLPAIRVEITCITPNKDGAKFVSETYMNSLRENGRRPNQGFYFDRVYLFEGAKVDVSAGSAGAGLSSGAPTLIGGRGRGVAAGATPGVSSGLPPEARDPLTNESIEDDWKFVIWVDVVLEDAPDVEGADTGSEG